MRGTCHFSAACAIFLVAALLPSAAFAQEVSNAGKDRCAAPNVRTDLRPDADGPPTKVTIGMQMVDLMGIERHQPDLKILFVERKVSKTVIGRKGSSKSLNIPHRTVGPDLGFFW